MALRRKSAARDPSCLAVRSVSDISTHQTSLTDDSLPQNGLPLRVLFFVNLKFSSWMKQLRLWTRIQRKLCKRHLTRRQGAGRQSLSLTAYPPFKTLIACKYRCHVLFTRLTQSSSYFIKEGRVSEAGTHDELLALRGDYYEYNQLQLLK